MTRTTQTTKIKMMTLTGLFSALIFVFTAYIHVPTGAGYTHAGDGLIYLAASMLPLPYAIAAGVIGAGLADGLSGFAVWIPATIIIKAITALFFTNKSEKIITKRNLLAIIPSLILCIVGYSLYEGIVITKSLSAAAIIAAFIQTPAYTVQVAASSVLYIVVGTALDKVGFKKKFVL
ncbi:MAG: TIGR04002 family protein [Ruminococcus sp.]|uniref:TIGR04002 family protein n=1 Tax=Ruminococcus sp. TaxID=41978 RepID=UPI0025F3CAA0|nr:TIGR04002 family protein [Ruminococcus sp.]MCR5600606.1 TIGR04002 family protein [Ruminococcus sp.]